LLLIGMGVTGVAAQSGGLVITLIAFSPLSNPQRALQRA
jgi:hypothetical protein